MMPSGNWVSDVLQNGTENRTILYTLLLGLTGVANLISVIRTSVRFFDEEVSSTSWRKLYSNIMDYIEDRGSYKETTKFGISVLKQQVNSFISKQTIFQSKSGSFSKEMYKEWLTKLGISEHQAFQYWTMKFTIDLFKQFIDFPINTLNGRKAFNKTIELNLYRPNVFGNVYNLEEEGDYEQQIEKYISTQINEATGFIRSKLKKKFTGFFKQGGVSFITLCINGTLDKTKVEELWSKCLGKNIEEINAITEVEYGDLFLWSASWPIKMIGFDIYNQFVYDGKKFTIDNDEKGSKTIIAIPTGCKSDYINSADTIKRIWQVKLYKILYKLKLASLVESLNNGTSHIAFEPQKSTISTKNMSDSQLREFLKKCVKINLLPIASNEYFITKDEYGRDMIAQITNLVKETERGPLLISKLYNKSTFFFQVMIRFWMYQSSKRMW